MQIKDHLLKVQGRKVYYRTIGDKKKQPILLLAGWPGIYLEKSGVLQELAKYFYVVSPEHPGLLRSDPLPKYIQIFNQYAELSRLVLKEEKLDEKKLVIMGQSFGGAVASHYAYNYPQFTKALILIDSVIGAGNIALYIRFLFRRGPKLTKLYMHLPKFIQKRIAFFLYGVPLENFTDKTMPDRQEMLGNYTSVVTNAWDNNEKLIDKDYGDFPILFVWGDRDGKEFNMYGSCNVDDAKIAADNLKKKGKDIKFITVDGGHTILYEKPRYVIGEIVENLPFKHNLK